MFEFFFDNSVDSIIYKYLIKSLIKNNNGIISSKW